MMRTRTAFTLPMILRLAILALAVTGATVGLVSASGASENFYGFNLRVLRVFGQPDTTQGQANEVTQQSIGHGSGVLVDNSSTPPNMYVVDAGNSRILGYRGIPEMDGSAVPDIIIGQPDGPDRGACNGDVNVGFTRPPTTTRLCLFGAPEGTNTAEWWMRINIDVDGAGNLYVPDLFNNRVLRFNAPLEVGGAAGTGDAIADLVIGQPDGKSNGRNRGDYFAASPAEVADPGRDRLWFDVGQPFFDNVSSRGVSADDDGTVWLADTFNGRILRFPPGSTTADLVIGQGDFTSNRLNGGRDGCSDAAALDRLCTPTLAKLGPDGSLVVLDERPAPFVARMLIFEPPFSNGMVASEVLIPNSPDFEIYAGSDESGTPRDAFFQATGFEFNPDFVADAVPDYADGYLWINEHESWRSLLIDRGGDIIEVLGARDAVHRGGDFRYGGSCGTIYDDDGHLWWPGGGFGFAMVDGHAHVYLADEFFKTVYEYRLPYEPEPSGGTPATCLPEPHGALFVAGENARPGSNTGNLPSKNAFGGGNYGLVAHADQLIVLDSAARLKVFNNYASGDLATGDAAGAADFEIRNGKFRDRARLSGAVDASDRLWIGTHTGEVLVYDLPITSDTQQPALTLGSVVWDDTGAAVTTDGRTPRLDSFVFEGGDMWALDHAGHRLLRIKDHTTATAELRVDRVIGQTAKAATECNQGMERTSRTLCDATQIKFDRAGNLFVVESNYECRGDNARNNRITMYSALALSSASGMFPNLAASKIYGPTSGTERGACSPETIGRAATPVSITFDRSNRMFVGNDGYYGDRSVRQWRQVWMYEDPASSSTTQPVDYVRVPLGAAAELDFDDDDNLLIQDHTYNRIFMVNPRMDPELIGGDVGIASAPEQVMHAVSCLAGNGRVDTNIVNTGADTANYRIEFPGLSPRNRNVLRGDWWRRPITGRADGTYSVVVRRDGAVVSNQSVTVQCDAASVMLDDPEVRVINACRAGLGYLLFQFVNPTGESKPYVIEFEGVPNRSTTAVAFGATVRAVIGRSDGDHDVLIRSGAKVVATTSVTVDCL